MSHSVHAQEFLDGIHPENEITTYGVISTILPDLARLLFKMITTNCMLFLDNFFARHSATLVIINILIFFFYQYDGLK